MATHRHLNNAPITEAIIDIRVVLSSGFDPDKFLSLSKELSNQYPKTEPRRVISGSLGIQPGKPPLMEPYEDKIHGYWYKSEDEKNIVQFRIDGFTFSRLKPYTEWETVLMEAKRLWELYYSESSPEVITRVAVRYINRLDLPLPIQDFNQYLTEPPKIPSTLPQGVAEFFSRLVIPEDDIIARVVQALQPGFKNDHIAIIFDIDVYKTQDKGIDLDSIWPIFERLRNFKNRIFFESITEETARLYE